MAKRRKVRKSSTSRAIADARKALLKDHKALKKEIGRLEDGIARLGAILKS